MLEAFFGSQILQPERRLVVDEIAGACLMQGHSEQGQDVAVRGCGPLVQLFALRVLDFSEPQDAGADLLDNGEVHRVLVVGAGGRPTTLRTLCVGCCKTGACGASSGKGTATSTTTSATTAGRRWRATLIGLSASNTGCAFAWLTFWIVWVAARSGPARLFH